MTTNNTNYADTKTLRLICENGRLDAAQWYFKTYEKYNFIEGIANDFNRLSHIMSTACFASDLEMLQWVYDTFHPKLLRKIDIRGLCTLNKLSSLEWLHETYKLTAAQFDSDVLSIVCANGYFDLAKWLHATFGLRPSENVKCDRTIQWWLERTFGVTS